MSDASPRKLTERDLRLSKPFTRALSTLNVWIFRLSGGRLGARFPGGAPVGLLTTVGRKTGQPRVAPLIYGSDGERVLLVASQAGMPRHPVWYLNLEANPEVEFQTGAEKRKMLARQARPAEKQALWPTMVAIYPSYDVYQQRTDRDIPLVILEPR